MPAKPIGSVQDLVNRLEADAQRLPWTDLLNRRDGGFDPEMEPQLTAARIAHFYPVAA